MARIKIRVGRGLFPPTPFLASRQASMGLTEVTGPPRGVEVHGYPGRGFRSRKNSNSCWKMGNREALPGWRLFYTFFLLSFFHFYISIILYPQPSTLHIFNIIKYIFFYENK